MTTTEGENVTQNNLFAPRFMQWKPGFVMFHEPRTREQFDAEENTHD